MKALFLILLMTLSISAASAEPVLVALTDSKREFHKTGKHWYTVRWIKVYQYRTADNTFIYTREKIADIPDNRTYDKRNSGEVWLGRVFSVGNWVRFFTN